MMNKQPFYTIQKMMIYKIYIEQNISNRNAERWQAIAVTSSYCGILCRKPASD